MSMLTPAGFSGRRRPRYLLRRTLAVLVALLVLGGAAFACWWYLVRDEAVRTATCPRATASKPGAAKPTGAAGKPAARPTRRVAKAPAFLPGRPLPARQVTVTVYNATDRDGLAARVAAQLAKRGFRVGTPANDPLGRKIPEPAEVRFGRTGAGAALRVGAQVAGAVPRVDGRADARVDLVLGDGFRRLRTVERAAAAAKPVAVKPTSPAPRC
jgi:hypothetical protein